MSSIGRGIRRDAAADALLSRGSRRPDLLYECTHAGLVPAIEPSLHNVWADGMRAFTLQTACPDCWLEISVRLFRPEAGGWYLKMQERLAAGRTWMFRYEGQTWHPGL